MNRKKSVIWLAGDSTMQSYADKMRPQWGWGEKLICLLEDSENSQGITVSHREDCPFAQEKRYEGTGFIVDNCAMAGRSSKTFREEGRLQDIEAHIESGDYLLIQFGHNDAGREKPERYVALEEFRASLANYVEMALEKGAHPILLSSIVLCPGEQSETGEAGEISRLLPEYGRMMERYAEEQQLLYIDMNKLTGEYIGSMTEEQAEELYLPDHVHLVEKGAEAYARLASPMLKKYIADTFCAISE